MASPTVITIMTISTHHPAALSVFLPCLSGGGGGGCLLSVPWCRCAAGGSRQTLDRLFDFGSGPPDEITLAATLSAINNSWVMRMAFKS